MTIDVYNTHIELYPYTKDQYPIIEHLYTATNRFTQLEAPCGYIIDQKKLYLPRGTSISQLESITHVKATYKRNSDNVDNMSEQFESTFPPRNKIQEEAILFLTKENHTQSALNLGTGIGKTFCVAYSSIQLGVKTLIITPNEGLKQQWIKTYNTMFNCGPKHLMNINGSNVMNAIMNDELKPVDVYFVNHHTLRNYIMNNNGYMFHNFMKKLNVGIKVYDESHMEFGNIILIDFFSNTERTWYLTATFDRSDPEESVCFKRAFNNVIAYGERETEEFVTKHVIYHIVNINSRITPKLRTKVIGYKGMSSVSYGKYAFELDVNDSAYKAILDVVKKLDKVEGKILIFAPLISAVDDIVLKLKKDVPDKKIAAYHSKVDKSDKDDIEINDIIVSTIKSCGTGKDIKGLRAVICAEPIASKVTAAQMIGRLRPYGEDKPTYFFDIVDICLAPINWWFRSRFKKIETLVKEVVYLDLDK